MLQFGNESKSDFHLHHGITPVTTRPMTETSLPVDDSSSKSRRRSAVRRFGLVLVVVALGFVAASFVILMGFTPIIPTNTVVIQVMAINGILVAALLAFLIKEGMQLFKARKKGRAAARLHIRIVGLFAIVATLPALFVAIAAGITLDLGLDRWFEDRTRSIVDSSISVAQAYVTESGRGLQNTALSMATFLDRGRTLFNLDRTGFTNLMTRQARGRGLSRAQLLRRDGSLILEADVPIDRPLPDVPRDILKAAEDGTPVYIPPGKTNLVGSVVRLREIPSAYLYTIRIIDPTVMGSIQTMQELTADYKKLESNRVTLQLTFALLYIGISLIVLLSAIWMGISVADRLVAPIRRLIGAADEISAGNLDVTVETYQSEGDLRSLGNTFNNMTSELRSQRDEILQTQEQIDQRRRFIEAVLSGVSAGVIGVDPAGVVTVINRSADFIIGETKHPVGLPLEKVSPKLSEVFKQAVASGKREFRKQISLFLEGRERTLNIQVTVEGSDEHEHSYVITIDDITNLVTAQRSSAWADVARRIAHEIKNPLTPIQLSAERLKRRFGKVIEKDREVFDQCTDTIVRQVSDIGRMVDEFSSFARMPKPTMVGGDLAEFVKEAVFLQKVANPDIAFKTDLGDEPLSGRFDPRLMAQVFTNVIKNATEAIEAVPAEERGKGLIRINGCVDAGQIIVEVIDNGKGLPEENRQRLLEPYMTTREKGTGLGLAIVGKILEDHNGRIELLDAPECSNGGRGAMMRLVLPANGVEGTSIDKFAEKLESREAV